MLRNRKKNAEKQSLLQRFGLYFYRKKENTIVYWVAIVLFGIASYVVLLPREGFPSVSVPVSVVTGTYVVNDESVVDAKLAKPAQEIVKSIPRVKEVATQSSKNFFVMTVTYEEGVTSAEGNKNVEEALRGTERLPQDVVLQFRPIDAGRFEQQSDLLLAVYSKTNSDVPLSERARTVAAKVAEGEYIKEAFYIDQYQTGKDQTTGEVVTLQKSYDITGTKDGIGQIFLKQSALVGVRAAPDADAFDVYNSVQATIADLQKDTTLSDVEFLVVADFAENITSQIDSLQQSLLEGLVVVIIVSFLLISWRAGLATALSMITVLLATVGVLYATGNSLNTITLFALILSLGLIVDDTTIMVEAIDAAKRKKLAKTEVVAAAIKKVARASFAGTLTTMLGFAPMLFIGGILGSFIRILPITIIIALAMSLLISLTLVPFFAHFLLSGSTKHNSFVGRLEARVSGFLSGLLQRMKGNLLRKFITAGVAIGFSIISILGSFYYFSRLKFDIFPSTKDSDALSLTVVTPPNTPIEKTSDVVMKASKLASDVVGSNFRRLSLQATGTSNGATAVIDLISYKQREKTAPQLVGELESAFTGFEGASVRVSQVDVGPPKEPYPFKVRILSEDAAAADMLAQDVRVFLNDRTIERRNGTTSRVARTEIRNDTVKRLNGERYLEVSAGFVDTDVSALVTIAKQDVEKEFTAEKLASYGLDKKALTFNFGNESDNQDSFKSMLVAFPVLLVAMFLLLAFQFRSLLQPLLIFAAIPYSFLGVAAGLYYTNNPLSFFVMIGFFALIGIAVNNTILLTDYANQARAEGKRPIDAMSLAITERFRPLIATSLTSVVALVPLALTDPFWESLAYTLIFGLLSSTLLVIVSFPYAYLVAEWLRLKVRRKKK
jgi:multidrug efflux pump subunit AcrB